MFRVHAVMSVYCSLVVTCWERANLLALLYVMFSCVFVTFLCGVLGQVCYLVVSIPNLCLLSYFVESRGLLSDSTCVLKAEPGKLDIKRCEPSIVFYQFTSCFALQTSDYDVIIDIHVDSTSFTTSLKCST